MTQKFISDVGYKITAVAFRFVCENQNGESDSSWKNVLSNICLLLDDDVDIFLAVEKSCLNSAKMFQQEMKAKNRNVFVDFLEKPTWKNMGDRWIQDHMLVGYYSFMRDRKNFSGDFNYTSDFLIDTYNIAICNEKSEIRSQGGALLISDEVIFAHPLYIGDFPDMNPDAKGDNFYNTSLDDRLILITGLPPDNLRSLIQRRDTTQSDRTKSILNAIIEKYSHSRFMYNFNSILVKILKFIYHPIYSSDLAHLDCQIALTGLNNNIVVGMPIQTLTDIDMFKSDIKQLTSNSIIGDDKLHELQRKTVKMAKLLQQSGFNITWVPLPLFSEKTDDFYLGSYTNVILENRPTNRVWMVEYGDEDQAMRIYDTINQEIWRSLGFEVRLVKGLFKYAADSGGVRCMTKVLARGAPLRREPINEKET